QALDVLRGDLLNGRKPRAPFIAPEVLPLGHRLGIGLQRGGFGGGFTGCQHGAGNQNEERVFGDLIRTDAHVILNDELGDGPGSEGRLATARPSMAMLSKLNQDERESSPIARPAIYPN